MDSEQKRRGRPPKQGRLHSPVDVGINFRSFDKAERPDSLVPIGNVHFYWEYNPGFGEYLRRVRDEADISMADAAEVLRISQPALSRLENRETRRIPKMKYLIRLAEMYGVDPQEMLHHAGIRIEVPRHFNFRKTQKRRFNRLMLEPQLRPAGVTEEVLEYVSPKLRQAFLSFLEKLMMMDNPVEYYRNVLHTAADEEEQITAADTDEDEDPDDEDAE